MNLTLNGEKILERVFSGAELYPEAQSEQLPDLICQSRPGYDLKAKFDRDEIFGLHGRTGTHTVDGAIFNDSDSSHPERMRDIGNTILEYFNISDS
jgi:predicted AlkP superfamily phosphohydrolase/phosphomutase